MRSAGHAQDSDGFLRRAGLVALGIAGYDAVYYWLDRAGQRRREARARERQAREGR